MLSSLAAPGKVIDQGQLESFLQVLLDQHIQPQSPRRVLLLPPDHTRLASRAGEITAWLYRRLATDRKVDVMPALGTHQPMSAKQFRMMFGDTVPFRRMVVHDWRNHTVNVGEVTSDDMSVLSQGKFREGMQVEVNKCLVDHSYDLILSIGQVVPHEVIGFANYSKNVCVGAGGKDVIHKSHFLGAVCNMETVLGRVENPVRRLVDQAYTRFIAPQANVMFVLTVVQETESGANLCGLFASQHRDGFQAAAALSASVNVTRLSEPVDRCVVYLDPREFRSTWLGNKAIYRTRMALADGGDLRILGPAIETFGEDEQIDALIRQHGYAGTPRTLDAVAAGGELATNLAAAAHLIHGCSEGRFQITYCPGVGLTRPDIERVGYAYQPLDEVLSQLPDHPERLPAGWHHFNNGQKFYYVKNPALGLWTNLDTRTG